MWKEKTNFMHMKVGEGRVTFAIRFCGEDLFLIAAAFCAPGDNFSRKVGRYISEGRLSTGNGIWSLYVGDDKSCKYVKNLVKDKLWQDAMNGSPLVPSWVKKAVKHTGDMRISTYAVVSSPK